MVGVVHEVLSVVSEIPKGKVATYGQIARLIGRDKNARLIGKVMSLAGYYGNYPCHRVVNSVGRLVLGWEEQRRLLGSEGVTFLKNNCVDLKTHLWTE